jgi:hypothetical protein
MFLRILGLPTVPQIHIVSQWVRALQAEDNPFVPDTAHQ